MNNELFHLSETLRDSIKNDPIFIELDKVEKELNENEEIMRKSYKKDVICSKYSDLLKVFDEDSAEIKKVRKELVEAKDELYETPLVKRYLQLYAQAREILDKVNDILLENIK